MKPILNPQIKLISLIISYIYLLISFADTLLGSSLRLAQIRSSRLSSSHTPVIFFHSSGHISDPLCLQLWSSPFVAPVLFVLLLIKYLFVSSSSQFVVVTSLNYLGVYNLLNLGGLQTLTIGGCSCNQGFMYFP